MRTLWVLILFGSLIIHHCFTTVSGEAISKEAQPSYSDCKPYVDAALKGDIPNEPPSAVPVQTKDSPTSDEEADDTDTTNEKSNPADDGDSSEELQPTSEGHDEENSSEEESDNVTQEAVHSQDDSSEEDHEEPEIKGLEVEDDEEEAKDGEDSKATAEESSEEDIIPPKSLPNPPASALKESQQWTKTKVEESIPKEPQSDESDEEDTRKATPNNPSSKTPQRDRGSHHSLAEESDESNESQPPPQSEEKLKKVKSHSKESKSHVKKRSIPNQTPESEEEERESDEEVEEEEVVQVVNKVLKGKKKTYKRNVKNEDEDEEESEEAEVKKLPPPPPKVKKSKKIVEVEDDDSEEEEVKKPPPPPPPNVKKSKKVVEVEDDDSQEEEVKPKKSIKKEKEKKIKKKVEESDEDDDENSEENSYVPRSRENLIRILGLHDTTDFKQKDNLLDKVTQQTLKELKNTYEYSIKPLETLYKYRDLSNRHFGDPEIFSKPMVVFMGPWSGGKSTIINWLLGIQSEEYALRTGADPSPAQFNIMIHGNEDEVLDGTQLAADWTFSGLQKFGQSFLDRLRGRKLPNRLLEKVNLVEIPGILEIRKQVERSFPFNDACQWFIDRADVLFLVYDPAKLDIGPETEAILDQLKGRESQVRIVLNKADSVKPDELLRVQATLIWNISPLMASAEPPVLYVASLWDHPLQSDSPASLLNAHENLFLKDISDATHKRVETRIAAARRFAVRVRNHAKMCDCYLNTYNNHRSFFSNKKRISDDIIEHPQNYHIYEGLSTLTNISRYDLPDPDTYRDFFRLNPIWEFPSLASTCTYFRGCPINKLDIAIAYDLPELLGRYRRQRESIVTAPTGTLPDIKLKEVPEKKDEPIDIPKGKNKWYKLPPEEQGDDIKKVNVVPTTATPTPSPKTEPPPAPTPTKPKNKWWKEVVEPVKPKEPEPPKLKEIPKKKKNEELKKPPGPPPTGYILVEPKNKFWKPFYETIKPKETEQQPKKNKWYKNTT